MVVLSRIWKPKGVGISLAKPLASRKINPGSSNPLLIAVCNGGIVYKNHVI